MLKNCPFCGEPNPQAEEKPNLESSIYCIYCTNCYASTGMHPTISKAVDYWNMRCE